MGVSHLCFLGNEAEAQRGYVTCLNSHSQMPLDCLNPSLNTLKSRACFVFVCFFFHHLRFPYRGIRNPLSVPLLLSRCACAHRVHETVLGGEASAPGMEFCSNRLLESFVAASDLEPGTANHFPRSPAQRTLLCKTSFGGEDR